MNTGGMSHTISLVKPAIACARQAVSGGLHLRLQAHIPRAVDGEQRKSGEGEENCGHIGKHDPAGVMPERGDNLANTSDEPFHGTLHTGWEPKRYLPSDLE